MPSMRDVWTFGRDRPENVSGLPKVWNLVRSDHVLLRLILLKSFHVFSSSSSSSSFSFFLAALVVKIVVILKTAASA